VIGDGGPQLMGFMPKKANHPQPPAEYVDTKGLASIVSLAAVTLKLMRQRGEGPPWIKVGKVVRYKLADARAWMDRRPGGGEVAR